MRIKNAFRILFSNVNYLYKATLYRTLCTAFAVLIAYFGIRPGLAPVFEAPEYYALIENVREIFTGFFQGAGVKTATDALPATFASFVSMLKEHMWGIKWAAIGGVIVIYVWDVLLAAGDYAFGKIFNGHMSSYTHFGFLPTFFDSPGAAFAYGALISLFNLVCGAIIIFVSVTISVYLISYISVIAILLGILLLVFGFATRHAIVSKLLPIMINEKVNFFVAFKRSVPGGKSLMSLTGNYAFMIMLLYYVNASIALFTFLTGLIVSLPFTALAIISFNFVDYYIDKNKKFYVDYSNVSGAEKDGQDAEYLKLM